MPRQSKNTASSDRAQRVAQLQRQAKTRDRRSLSAIWIGLSLVLALIAGLVTWAIVSNEPVDLGAVEVYDDPEDPADDLERTHVETAVPYEQQPAVGGPHHQAWWTCGTYEEQVPDHHAVHSLEHGAVSLTYQPGIADDQLDELRDLADQDFVLLSPYEGQEAPVMATAWGHQMSVDSADDPRVAEFVREYRQGPQTPEPGVTCDGGTTTDLLGG
ncbi:MAG: DUF3105 domain-containing protein [Actinomycetota bacterium]|nr:DUF3105 domain-containing protein [Actinomycetota bacterium]